MNIQNIESNWVEYEGASKVLFTHIDLPNRVFQDAFKHLKNQETVAYVYSDGVDVWAVGYGKHMVTKVYVPRSSIRGHLSPMYLVNGTNWAGVAPQLSIATVIFPNGETRYYIGNQNHTFTQGSMPVDGNGDLPVVLNVNEICHTWAVSSEVGWDVVKNITAQGKKKTPSFAVISARPSNIGAAYYNPQNGELEKDFEPLAQRYKNKYIGRTSSWNNTTRPESIGIEPSHVSDIFKVNDLQVDSWEFHFPKKHIPKKNEQHNILGTTNNRLLGGFSIVLQNGVIIRRLWRRDYQRGSPLTDSVQKTRFNTIYEPLTEPNKSWTDISNLLGDEDMTPKELETVKKWFAGYCNHKARKGEIPSDDELEIAKRLGVYTGN